MKIILALIASVIAYGYAAPTSELPSKIKSLFTDKEVGTVLPPNVGGQPVTVLVNMYLRDFEVKKNHIHVVLTLRQEWNDQRLKYETGPDYINLPGDKISEKIWTPDLFWQNAISSSEKMNEGLIRIKKNGDVLYSKIVEEHFRCWNISLLDAGAPHVDCYMAFSSYGHTVDEVVIKSRPQTPVQVNLSLMTNNPYEIIATAVEETDQSTGTGKYHGVKVVLTIGKQ